MIKAVSFDLGGTLIQFAEPGFCTRLARLVPLPDEVRVPLIARHFLTKIVEPELAIAAFCEEAHLDVSTVLAALGPARTGQSLSYEDVAGVLLSLRGYQLAAISNVTCWE